MRNIKEGSENNPRFKMMEAGVTISDVAKGYGREVAEALVQFCKIRKLSIDNVVNDESEDRNGMTLWDKFDSWAQNRLGLDIMANYEQGDDWTVKGTKSDKNANEYDNPDQFINEGSGSEPVDEYFISNWIGDALQDCEWIDPLQTQYAGDEPWVEIATPDGDVYRVQVTKVYSGKLGTYLDER